MQTKKKKVWNSEKVFNSISEKSYGHFGKIFVVDVSMVAFIKKTNGKQREYETFS